MKTKGLIGLLMLLVLGGCGADKSADPLIGVWLQPIKGQPGMQGFQFDADGTVVFLNTFSMMGVDWQRTEEGNLEISSHTERFPEPRSDTWEIRELTDKLLVLAGPGQPEGSGQRFERHLADGPVNSMVGRWVLPDGSFYEITPLVEGFRVVVADSLETSICLGIEAEGGLKVSGEGKEFTLSVVTGSETGQEELKSRENCLSVDGLLFVCR